MATYDQQGNVISEDIAVYPTADPDIVKMKVKPGQSLPVYSTLAEINGQAWAFFPTEKALAIGKVIAALDTVSELPTQIEQQFTELAKAAQDTVAGIPDALKLLIVAVVAYGFLTRK